MYDVKSAALAAVTAMQKDGIILYPTDTVWGLGCDARSTSAIEKLYEIKQRPHATSMLVLVESRTRLENLVGTLPIWVVSELNAAERPTTIIYPEVRGVNPCLLASDGSLGIRLVTHELCSAIIAALDAPLVSTSANLSGHATPARFASIETCIKERVDWVAPEVFDTAHGKQGSRILKIDGTHFVTIRD